MRVLSPSFQVGAELKQNMLLDEIAFKEGDVNHSSQLFLETPHPVLGRFSPVDIATSGSKNWNSTPDLRHKQIDSIPIAAAPNPQSLHPLRHGMGPPVSALTNYSADDTDNRMVVKHHRMALKRIESHLKLDCNPTKVQAMHPSEAFVKKIEVPNKIMKNMPLF